jgi:hypothetical protein
MNVRRGPADVKGFPHKTERCRRRLVQGVRRCALEEEYHVPGRLLHGLTFQVLSKNSVEVSSRHNGALTARPAARRAAIAMLSNRDRALA